MWAWAIMFGAGSTENGVDAPLYMYSLKLLATGARAAFPQEKIAQSLQTDASSFRSLRIWGTNNMGDHDTNGAGRFRGQSLWWSEAYKESARPLLCG